MDNKLTRSEAAPHLALVAVQLFFGSLPVIGKVVLREITPLGLVGFRVGITALALILIQWYRGRIWLKNPRDYLPLAVLSLFGVTLNQLFFISGLSLTKAANTSLLSATIPIFTLTISSWAGTEKLRGTKILGIIFAAIGVLIIIDPRNASFSSSGTIGDLLIVINSLSYGIYVATSKETISRNGAFRSMMWVFIFASVICVPLGGISMATANIISISGVTALLILYIAIGATASPYILNAWALARVSPSTVAVYVYLQPLIGFLCAVIFLGEHIDFRFLIASALIFAGVYFVTKKFELSTP
jgi:drug/metabolite transporter (DMT)-like permease